MTPDSIDEARAVDSMTHAMLSSSMLLALMDALNDEQRCKMTIRQFFDSFMKTHQSERFVPFNEGVIRTIMYWVMFMKENWWDLIPEDDLSVWHVVPVSMTIPLKSNPTIKYFVRRLRNSMGHNAPAIHVPVGVTLENMREQVTMKFHDHDVKNPSDTFDVELKLGDAFDLTHRLHAIVLADVAKRHGVEPPKSQ